MQADLALCTAARFTLSSYLDIPKIIMESSKTGKCFHSRNSAGEGLSCDLSIDTALYKLNADGKATRAS